MIPLLRWFITLTAPFFLGFGVILAVIAWDYPAFEYARIPPDRFGFTTEERLFYGHATLAYLRQPEPSAQVIHLLEELRLPNSDAPLYNPAEIQHMVDVKNLTDTIRKIWQLIALITVLGLAFLLSRPQTRPEGFKAIYYGGLTTTALLILIAGFILLGWSVFFVQFHELLFPPGTWTFAYSDSLIRLFPEQFWFDIGVIMSVGSLLLGVVTAVIGYFLVRAK